MIKENEQKEERKIYVVKRENIKFNNNENIHIMMKQKQLPSRGEPPLDQVSRQKGYKRKMSTWNFIT